MRGVFLRLIATSAAVRRIIELTGAQEALVMERSTTDRSVQFSQPGTDATYGQKRLLAV